MINLEKLVGGYAQTPIIKGIDLAIRKGEFFALLGQNGSGKTTLFKLITGQLPIQSGKVLLAGTEIRSLSKIAKAKKMAVLSQEVKVSFDYTVEEIIALGRYPHQKGFFKRQSKKDRQVIEELMELTKTSQFRGKQFRKLSGGEKQRVLLAKALAQEPEVLLLDEPTNHLDIKHTFYMLDLLKERQKTMGLTIFAILHDLNIASLYADRIALLHEGRFLEAGDVNELRKVEQLKKVYEVKINAQSHPNVPKPQLLLTPDYASASSFFSFEHSYRLQQKDGFFHLQFEKPLRTISNGKVGAGIQWLKHFCLLSVEREAPIFSCEKVLRQWLERQSIPYLQAAVMPASGSLKDIVIEKETYEDLQMMVVVSGIAAIPSSASGESTQSRIPINLLLFIDAHFTDEAILNSYMMATEALWQVVPQLSLAHGTDTVLLGVTQQGRNITDAGYGTTVGQGIAELVARAVKKAIKKDLQTV